MCWHCNIGDATRLAVARAMLKATENAITENTQQSMHIIESTDNKSMFVFVCIVCLGLWLGQHVCAKIPFTLLMFATHNKRDDEQMACVPFTLLRLHYYTQTNERIHTHEHMNIFEHLRCAIPLRPNVCFHSYDIVLAMTGIGQKVSVALRAAVLGDAFRCRMSTARRRRRRRCAREAFRVTNGHSERIRCDTVHNSYIFVSARFLETLIFGWFIWILNVERRPSEDTPHKNIYMYGDTNINTTAAGINYYSSAVVLQKNCVHIFRCYLFSFCGRVNSGKNAIIISTRKRSHIITIYLNYLQMLSNMFKC